MFWVRSLTGQRCMVFGYNNYFYISNIAIYAMYFMAVSMNYDAYKGFIVFFFTSVNAMSAPIRGRYKHNKFPTHVSAHINIHTEQLTKLHKFNKNF